MFISGSILNHEKYENGKQKLRLGPICVTELQRPAKALELLHQVDFSKQPDKHGLLAKKIAHKAKPLQAEGVYELEDEAF